MSYRDDLAAAHARIEALEAQIGMSGTELHDTRTLLAKTTELFDQLSKLREEMNAINETHERLQRAMKQVGSEMPTLYEHNRSVPPGENALSGKPAGVRCPMCLILAGESVQMRTGGNLRMMLWQSGNVGPTNQTTRCPRCDYFGVMFS